MLQQRLKSQSAMRAIRYGDGLMADIAEAIASRNPLCVQLDMEIDEWFAITDDELVAIRYACN